MNKALSLYFYNLRVAVVNQNCSLLQFQCMHHTYGLKHFSSSISNQPLLLDHGHILILMKYRILYWWSIISSTYNIFILSKLSQYLSNFCPTFVAINLTTELHSPHSISIAFWIVTNSLKIELQVTDWSPKKVECWRNLTNNLTFTQSSLMEGLNFFYVLLLIISSFSLSLSSTSLILGRNSNLVPPTVQKSFEIFSPLQYKISGILSNWYI